MMTHGARLIDVVDDNAANRELLSRRLSRRGYEVREFSSGEELLAAMGRGELPDAILLDLMMPGLDGLQVLRELRAREPTLHVPVIMISAAGEDATVIEALHAGANDYVTKPVNFDVLIARLETQLRMRDALETIRAQRDMMESLALIDPLTEVYNRRAFEARLADELERSRRTGRPLSLLFFDVDHFKRVNDLYGHQVGDTALRWVAQQLRDSVRAADVVARYGGEEFCIILPETALAEAMSVAERSRRRIAADSVPAGESFVRLTVSVGVADSPMGELEAAELLRRADLAVYAAKQAGRNCVRAWSPDLRGDPSRHSL